MHKKTKGLIVQPCSFRTIRAAYWDLLAANGLFRGWIFAVDPV